MIESGLNRIKITSADFLQKGTKKELKTREMHLIRSQRVKMISEAALIINIDDFFFKFSTNFRVNDTNPE